MSGKKKYPPHPAFIEHTDGSITSYSKTCTKCRVTKLLDEFNGASKYPDGRTSHCRSCIAHAFQERYATDTEHMKELHRKNARRYRQANLEQEREKARRWRLDNPERAKESDRKTAKKRGIRLRNRTDAEIVLDQQRLRPAGTKRCLAGHVEELAAFSRDRGKPDGLRDICRQHDNLKHLKQVWPRWHDLDAYRCVRCGADFDHVDHALPLARIDEFGEVVHDPANLQPMCESCNTSKRDRTMAERWPDEHFAIYQTVMMIRGLA